jgi:hypothetical protein
MPAAGVILGLPVIAGVVAGQIVRESIVARTSQRRLRPVLAGPRSTSA